jgi:glycosyltransferase involved in cell wall biosynthesis
MHQHIINDQIQAWFFLRNSDCLSYVSNAVRNEVLANTSFRNTLIGNKKERIIYNCIDVNAYRNEEISDKNYILFVGRISKLKGLHLLLCAFKEVEKKYKYVKLIIAGDFNWSEEGQYFSDLIQKLNFKNLIIKDNPTAKELRELYGNCSFVVLPSIFPDPQPLTILEAYANCKPVIGSDAGGIPEMIDDCETGKIVQRGSVQALYDAMVELIENEEQRIVLGKKGFHKLMNKYTVEKVSNEYSQLYHELIYGE